MYVFIFFYVFFRSFPSIDRVLGVEKSCPLRRKLVAPIRQSFRIAAAAASASGTPHPGLIPSYSIRVRLIFFFFLLFLFYIFRPHFRKPVYRNNIRRIGPAHCYRRIRSTAGSGRIVNGHGADILTAKLLLDIRLSGKKSAAGSKVNGFVYVYRPGPFTSVEPKK